jgi:hypothetical protein
MAVCPEWLGRRGGALELGADGSTWFVLFDRQPQYALQARPAQSKVSCHIRQINNGQRIDSPGTYSREDEAIRGGLEDLRKALGW